MTLSTFVSTRYFSHYRALIKLGVPIMIGQIGILALGFADTLMVGHHSTNELAAASFVNNIFVLVIIATIGFSLGLISVVSGLLSGSHDKEIGGWLKHSLVVNSLVGVLSMICMGIFYFFIPHIGQPVELLPLIKPFFFVLWLSMPFVACFNAFKQWADSIMDTRLSMWILIGGNLLNILGSYLLIYGVGPFPEMGLLGAGFATLFSRMAMCVAFAIYFSRVARYRSYREGFLKIKIQLQSLKRLASVGWPIALQMGMEAASFSLCAILVGWLGTIALAAHQVMLTISTLCFMVYVGMGGAIAVRCSYFKGQGDGLNIRRSAYAGFHLIMVLVVIASVSIFTFRGDFGGWFTEDPRVSAVVATLFAPMLLYQFGDGLQIAFANALRGIADVKPMMYVAFVAYFMVSLPASYFFGFILHWGIVGVWMGFPLGLTLAGTLFWLRFRSQTKLR